MNHLVYLFAFAAGCGASITPQEAQDAVRKAAAEANPSGRVGYELIGKTQWVKAPDLGFECLQSKDLAFVDSPGSGKGNKISPTWLNQSFITADTEKGWCVLLGEGITVDVGAPVEVDDGLQVPVTYTMQKPSPWFECLLDTVRTRQVKVSKDEAGVLQVEGELAMVPSGCPTPMPGGEVRGKAGVPTDAAPAAPTRAEVLALLTAFDEALWNKERSAALEKVACYNLHDENSKFGSCAPSELIQVGPQPRGEIRPGDGNPWLEYVVSSFDDIGAIKKDAKIPGMYHVLMTHKRTGRDRSLSVQWVDGQWKLVGVVGALGADLTSLRFVYDLHRNDKRDIFLKRLAGEKIDEQGNPTEPELEE